MGPKGERNDYLRAFFARDTTDRAIHNEALSSIMFSLDESQIAAELKRHPVSDGIRPV
jgi:hypothetical protein